MGSVAICHKGIKEGERFACAFQRLSGRWLPENFKTNGLSGFSCLPIFSHPGYVALMEPTDIGWRQARIFTSDFSGKGYFGLLTTFAKAFVGRYPETPFWFSRYAVPAGTDDGDTEISSLPRKFLHPQNLHFSIRFRFLPRSDEEIFLETLFGESFWHSDFRFYDILSDLGSDRFCPSPELPNRLRRVALLSRLLHAHCLFLLDTIGPDSTFELNGHEQNHFYKSTFLSTLHLFNNVVGQSGGDGFNLYATDKPLTGTDLKYVPI